MLDNDDHVLFVGGVSSLAVCSALVASFRSPSEKGENGENRPVSENKPVRKKSPFGENGENIPVGYS